MPGAGTSGPAQIYPLEFDFSSVTAAALVGNVNVTLMLRARTARRHARRAAVADGTAVVLMASAGGATAVPSGTRIVFDDWAAAPIANAGPIVNNTLYKPGGHYGGDFVQLGRARTARALRNHVRRDER